MKQQQLELLGTKLASVSLGWTPGSASCACRMTGSGGAHVHRFAVEFNVLR